MPVNIRTGTYGPLYGVILKTLATMSSFRCHLRGPAVYWVQVLLTAHSVLRIRFASSKELQMARGAEKRAACCQNRSRHYNSKSTPSPLST